NVRSPSVNACSEIHVSRLTALLVLLLTTTFDLALASNRPCPPFSSQNPISGTSSIWTGDFAGIPATCALCAYVVQVGSTTSGGILGRCRVKHIGHRRFLSVSFTDVASGTVWRRASSPPRRCCTLMVPAVMFDATTPPVSLTGTFACPHRSGTASFSLTAQ